MLMKKQEARRIHGTAEFFGGELDIGCTSCQSSNPWIPRF
jgi:hypothetical protein